MRTAGAALLAAMLLTAAAPAGAAQLSVDGGVFRYDGAAGGDGVVVQTLVQGGQFQLDVASTQGMVRGGGAVARCPIDGTLIRCDATGLARVEVRLGDGTDGLHMVPPRDGAAALPAVAYGEGGEDRLTGGPADDLLDGGEGDDGIWGWAGADTIDGGPGDDLIDVADGVADTVDCGPGSDRLIADPVDVHSGCELFGPAPPEPGPGGPAPAPPQPPAPEPGPPHSELPPPAPAIVARLARGRGGGRVTRLVVRNVPDLATVTLTCSSPRRGACPFRRVRSRHRHGADRLDLRSRLRGRRLPPGTVLTVRVSDRLGELATRRIAVRR